MPRRMFVVGSQARILYADAEGRSKIAEAFNKAIAKVRSDRQCWVETTMA